MLQALFALLLAVSAVAAWRRSPLYSKKTALRSAAVVIVAIAALIGIIVGAVNLSINRPPIVMAAILGSAIVFCALSMIFIIQRVTTPAAARLTVELPPSTKLVHTHRRKAYKLAKFFAILLGSCGILAIALPGDAKFAVLAPAAVALLLALVLLPVMYISMLKLDRSLTALQCNSWVHWQYTPEQWKAWIDTRVERLQATPPQFILKRDWRKLGWTFGSIAGGIYIFAPAAFPALNPWLEKTLYVAGFCGVIFAILMLSVGATKHQPEKLRTALGKAAPEVYFGHDGVFCDGAYTTWLTIDVYLTSASIDTRPPRSLSFHFEKVVPNPYTGNPIVPIQQSVLIPAGAEADISRLRQELTARCPKARIMLD